MGRKKTSIQKNIKKQILKDIKIVQKQIDKIKKIGLTENSKEVYHKKYGFDDKTNDIFYAIDNKGVIKHISSNIKNYGFQPDKIISKKFIKFIIPADRERLLSEFQKTIETGEEFISRFRLKNKKGDIYWFEDNGKVQRNKFGKIIGLKGFLHDINEHVQMKDRLRERCLSLENFIKENSDRIVEIENKIVKLKKDEAVILNSIQEHVVYQDLDNRVLWANKSAADSIGLSVEEMQGHYCYELWQEKDKPCAGCPVIEARETGQIQEEETITPDGKIWRVKGAPVKDVDGNIKAVVELTLDITEKEKSKIELERKEKIIDSSINAVALSDLGGNLLYVNSSFLKMWGFDNRDEIIGKSVSGFWKSKEKALGILGIVKEKDFWVGELVAKRKDNSFFSVEVLANLVKDKKGNPLYLASSFIDITEQKKARDALKESENKFKTVTEKALTGVYLIKDSKFTYVNSTLAKMFGYKRNEIVNKLGPLELTHPDDRKTVKEKIAERINKQQDMAHYRFRGLCKNGDIIICEVLGRLIEIDNEPAIMGNLINITPRMKAKERLNVLNEELQATNSRLEELALKDAHTGLYNYRYLKQSVESEFQRAKRYELPLSVIILDIDYFKSINDTYGHQFGDLVLKQLAEQFERMVRQYDTVARFGGNSFVIISPESDRVKSLSLAQRILNVVNLYNFGNKEITVKLGLSIGIISWPEDKVFRSMELIDIADRILSKAKEDGGNRIYTSDDVHNKRVLIEDTNEDIKFLKSKIKKLSKESNQSLMESVFAFAKTIKLKDNYTGEHVENTVTYALEIGRELGLDNGELESVRQAAILHDLGKLGISESILNKKAELSEEEFKEIKKHPQIGVDIIRPLRFLHDIIPFVLYHHERFDGKGYPRGLKGEDIPIGARIVAVADVYQALISDRPYRKAYANSNAIEMIKNKSGTQFDPTIVDLFIKVLKQNK